MMTMTNDWGLPIEVVKDVMRIMGEKGAFPKVDLNSPILLLYGTAGSGKTCSAVRISLDGEGWLFVSCVELLDRMVGCDLSADVKKLEQRAKDAPRLIIDEAGLEGNVRFSKFADFNSLDIIRKILMARLVANKRTIITTNMAPEALFAKYDKVKDASGRIYSRFSNHARIYFMEGDRRINKEGQVYKHTERTWLDECSMLDEDADVFKGEGKVKNKTPLKDRIKATIPLYEETEEELYKQEDDRNTKERIEEAIVSVRGKPGLECILFSWLETTKYKTLIPKEWKREQEKARKEAEVSQEQTDQKQTKRGVGGPAGEAAAGGDVRGGDVSGRGHRRDEEGSGGCGTDEPSPNGADAIDDKAVPDW